MTRLQYVIGFLFVALSTSCATYERSFSETLSTIPETQKKPVYRLDLSRQNLKHPPANLASCTSLKMLNLSGNVGLDLEAILDEIANPEVLEILILDSLQLKEIPSNIKRFTHLKHLSLNHNPAADFDAIFNTVKDLPIAFLNLQHNTLKKLPEALTNLQELNSINLNHNRLHSGESYTTLSLLPKLSSLWLTHNELVTLPPEIGQLRPLRNLYIEHNQLTSFPLEITQLKRLWVLHAGHNLFEEIPLELSKMKILILLHLNNNKIHHISEAFASKKHSIKGIILNNNALSAADKKRWAREFDAYFIASF